jgi:hypothetical protein
MIAPVMMMANWRDIVFKEHIPQPLDQRWPVEGMSNRHVLKNEHGSSLD